MHIEPRTIRAVEAELMRLRQELDAMTARAETAEALVREATQTSMIVEINDFYDDASCFFCSHRWSYTDRIARQNISIEQEQHFDDCWVVRSRAALESPQ